MTRDVRGVLYDSPHHAAINEDDVVTKKKKKASEECGRTVALQTLTMLGVHDPSYLLTWLSANFLRIYKRCTEPSLNSSTNM